jgi:hypothetical protein
MAYWRFSDGTLLHSHALVVGDTPLAHHLRSELMGLGFGCAPLVWLEDQHQTLELDPADDWLLWKWAEQEARAHRVSLLESDYRSPQPLAQPA